MIDALKWLANRTTEKHHFSVSVQANSQAEPVHENTRLLLFECVRELLLNAIKHSGVQEATVDVTCTSEGMICVAVEDHGCGFDSTTLGPHYKAQRSSLGLFSIQQRLACIEGQMKIETRPGQGTRVILLAPLRQEQPIGEKTSEN